jgi:hypothetical protein
MDLLFGLATVDKMQNDRLGRQLANGWMGWESKTMRRVRALGARALVTLAAWLDPAHPRALMPELGATDARTTV